MTRHQVLMAAVFAITALAWVRSPCMADSPPYHTKDPATEENFRVIFDRMSTHTHDNDGSVRLDPFIFPPRADIQGAIISETEGEAYWNTVDKEVCVSTAALDSGAWVKMHDPTTPCGH